MSFSSNEGALFLPQTPQEGSGQQSTVTAGAFWGQVGQTLAGTTQARSNCGLGRASYIMPSSVPLSVICLQCCSFGQRLRVSLPKSQRQAVTPNSGVASYHPSPTPMDTKSKHLGGKRKHQLQLFLWSCYQPAFSTDKDRLPHRDVKFGRDAPCSESGHCCLQQLGSVPASQHSKAMIPRPCTFLGVQRDSMEA